MEKILYLATPYFTSMEAFPASNPRVEIHLFGDKETVWKVKKIYSTRLCHVSFI
jgi:hypothetical protein